MHVPAYRAQECAIVFGPSAHAPLKSAETRLQCAQPGAFGGPIDCIRKTYRLEGFRAFYKGPPS